ncbi:hypothetical protein Aduo_012909 [Ancylostoma duodenale]
MELDHQPRDNGVEFRSAMRQVRENEHVHPAGLAPFDEERASRELEATRAPTNDKGAEVPSCVKQPRSPSTAWNLKPSHKLYTLKQVMRNFP